MERAARPLTTRDTVLLITHAAGDQVAGRTVMQKLAYFTGLGLHTALPRWATAPTTTGPTPARWRTPSATR